jgi:hypothetical protein
MAVVLTGCEDRLTGVYRESNGFGSLEFRADGTVYVTMGVSDSTFVARYELDGQKVIVSGPAGSQVYTIASDGTIEGGMGMRFQKSQALSEPAPKIVDGG